MFYHAFTTCVLSFCFDFCSFVVLCLQVSSHGWCDPPTITGIVNIQFYGSYYVCLFWLTWTVTFIEYNIQLYSFADVFITPAVSGHPSLLSVYVGCIDLYVSRRMCTSVHWKRWAEHGHLRVYLCDAMCGRMHASQEISRI